MALSTSGTVSTVAFDTRTLIDRAYGTLGVLPQQVTGEKIQIAQDLLALVLADLINTSAPLWTIDKLLLPLVQGQRSYSLGAMTSDVHSIYYRTMSNVSPAAPTSTSAAYTFDFGTPNIVSSWSITWTGAAVPVVFQSSADGVTWSNTFTSGLLTSAGTGLLWYDMSITKAARFWRVIPATTFNGAPVTNTLSITTAGVYNNPTSILLSRLNRDDYLNLTNNVIEGRPTQYFLNRGVSPNVSIWQAPDATAALNLLEVIRKRSIMDVGSLQQTIEVPTRWFYTIIFCLGDALGFVTPEADPTRHQMVTGRMQQMLQNTWTEERDKSPIKFNLDLGPYTR